jgi:hypothetical protein
METRKSTFIEKFKGDFNLVEGGCTILHTQAIQLLSKIDNLSIYTYLCSKPAEWVINSIEVSNHFNIGIKRVYAAFSDLIMIGLLTKVEIKTKGRFVKYEYYLHLSPLGQNDLLEKLSPNRSAINRSAINRSAILADL